MDEDDLLLDESLSPLEKIFLFAKSDLIFHRYNHRVVYVRVCVRFVGFNPFVGIPNISN